MGGEAVEGREVSKFTKKCDSRWLEFVDENCFNREWGDSGAHLGEQMTS